MDGWMVTSAIKMAVSNVDGVDDKVFNGLSFHPPDSKPHYWHLVAAAQSVGCHFFSSFSTVELELELEVEVEERFLSMS